MSSYRLLEWDTDFFGFPVATILPPSLSTKGLTSILTELKEKNVSLAYWPSDSNDEGSQEAALSAGGFLADRKATYVTELEEGGKNYELELMVEEYKETTLAEELKHLTLMSGIYSRYNMDPKVSQKQFEELYTLRIENSIRKTVADAIFVVRLYGKILGMVVVGEKNGRGDVSLLAVDVPVRRRGFGKMLVKAAQSWHLLHGHAACQVVTQERNVPARRLYETCGYEIENVENFYHFWL